MMLTPCRSKFIIEFDLDVPVVIDRKYYKTRVLVKTIRVEIHASRNNTLYHNAVHAFGHQAKKDGTAGVAAADSRVYARNNAYDDDLPECMREAAETAMQMVKDWCRTS